MKIFANFAWGHSSEFLSYDIDSRCKTHLLDRNFSKIEFMLPPEISTTYIFDFLGISDIPHFWDEKYFLGWNILEISHSQFVILHPNNYLQSKINVHVAP